jgi:hypothetical protein
MLGLLGFIFFVVLSPWILGGLMSLFASILPFIIIVMVISAVLDNSSKK